ncbi:Muniscin C-terminal mu homology domain-containing protein [Aspergillus coremiiformis]|uniref:Muniscin C-terminal mu homology domain-containing protein n=1 Tax=Aspergillus coremiiformis TaxID=138285 RepID=A0A5N6Z9W3_9EURO|nr:Muniscin C-terminal mu homology domain-containing protein [Aspergillus coremiiformis]
MMDLSRQEYPALLPSLQPSQASGVLNDRIRLINKINSDIADWLQERRRVEEAYAQGLRKLATRQQLDNGAALGIFQIPWQRIVNATEMVASSHETFAQKIEEDVERPLRDYHSKNRELASMPGIQSDLAALAKNLEASHKKMEKAREKGPKGADKLAGAIATAEEVKQQWESRAPFVFEQLQAADESRLNHLRDVLTQLETHESDQVERCRQAAENCLSVLLNVETADEIKIFSAKVNGGRPRQQISPTPGAAPPGPPPRIHDDTASQRSETSGPVRTPPAPEPQPRHSTPLGGLKRLGTVMNRRKSIVQPSGGTPFFSDKKHRSPFASFKRGDSRDMQIPESPPPGEERPGTALTIQETPNEAARVPSETHGNEGHDTITSHPTAHSAPATANGATPSEPPTETGLTISDSNQPRVDSEGFSEPPQTIDEITRAQREAAGLEEPGINLTIRDQPIFEDEDQAKQAMDDMASQLRMRAQQTGVRRNTGTLRGRRDVRNTVFIPNPPLGSDVPTVPLGSDISMPASPGLPSKHAPSPSTATDDHALSDTTSVRSGHTLHSTSGPVTHPDLHEPGLNASIIETVNAWFSEGAVTKSSVIGELALAYNGTPEANAIVRLDNFQDLEKVAANPHFVNEEKDKDLSDEKRGQYSIHLLSIARPSPTVAFKYQLHVETSEASTYCPVIFKPAWNIEEHQASVIVFYSLNPSFTSSMPRESITLKNLVLTVNLDTSPETGREVAHATSAVMYPNTGASFRRKHSAVTWKIPEFEVKAGTDSKLLVRFSTATSWPRKGKVDAKFEVHTSDAGSRLGISAASQAESTQKGSDPFADEDSGAQDDTQLGLTWKEVPTTRKLVGGKYVSS